MNKNNTVSLYWIYLHEIKSNCSLVKIYVPFTGQTFFRFRQDKTSQIMHNEQKFNFNDFLLLPILNSESIETKIDTKFDQNVANCRRSKLLK